MLSSLAWVPRGASAVAPEAHEVTREELDALVRQQRQMSLADLEAKAQAGAAGGAGDEEEDEEEEGDGAEGKGAMRDERAAAPREAKRGGARSKEAEREAAVLKELNMDAYDDEEDEEAGGASGAAAGGAEREGAGLMFYASNAEDPYLVGRDPDEESDNEDAQILPSDYVMAVAHAEEENNLIEVYVYDDSRGALYVHHDVPLSSMPVAVAWTSACGGEGKGSFAAVGTMEPGIELWNLDVLNRLEPTATLGGRAPGPASAAAAAAAAEDEAEDGDEASGAEKSRARKRKDKKKKKERELARAAAAAEAPLQPGSHAKAVISLSWHPVHVERLASGSADRTVKLWDLTRLTCVDTLRHHAREVQALQWNPSEPSVLLTGGYDQQVAMIDVRAGASAAGRAPRSLAVDSKVESLRWNPHNPAIFVVSTESGRVACYDARKDARPIFALEAHSAATSGLSFNAVLPHVLATCSEDRSVKLWDLSAARPELVSTKTMEVGALFFVHFEPSVAHLLVAGGSEGKLALWDLTSEDALVSRYGKPLTASAAP